MLAKNESTGLLTGHAATTDLEVAVATKKPCSMPHARYVKIDADHVIHVFKPPRFVQEVVAFADPQGIY